MEVLVALCLAFLVWLYTHSRQESALDQVDVPVKITLAAGTAGKYELQIHGSSRIPMSFTGPPSRIRELRRSLHRGQLQVSVQVSVPEEYQNENVYHDMLQIESDGVPVPPGVVTVIAEGQGEISYTLYRLVERHLPVQLDYTGDMRLTDVKLEPATVMVRGPKEILDRARFISTQPYNLILPAESTPGGEHLVQGQASLVSELEGRPVKATPSSVSVSFKAHPRKKTYTLRDIPVRFLCPPNFAWTPRFVDSSMRTVTVQVLGPTTEEPPTALAYIDLTGVDLRTGRNVQPVRISLAGEYQLVGDQPPPFIFYLDPVDCIEPVYGP